MGQYVSRHAPPPKPKPAPAALVTSTGARAAAARSRRAQPPPPPPPADPAPARPAKRIPTAGIRERLLSVEPARAEYVFDFRDPQGRPICWRLGVQSADEFAKGLDQNDVVGIFFPTRRFKSIKVFFPIAGRYFAMRKVPSTTYINLLRLLRHIQYAAETGMAYHMTRYQPGVTKADVTADAVRAALRGTAVCDCRISRNNVFVTTASSPSA